MWVRTSRGAYSSSANSISHAQLRRTGRRTTQCSPAGTCQWAGRSAHMWRFTSPAEPFKATTDVLEIVFLQEGRDLDRAALLLHGWPDDATTWLPIAKRLSEAGIRTISPWLRGFGQTRFLSASTCRDGRAEALAQDALDLMDALGIWTFLVIGARARPMRSQPSHRSELRQSPHFLSAIRPAARSWRRRSSKRGLRGTNGSCRSIVAPRQ